MYTHVCIIPTYMTVMYVYPIYLLVADVASY